MRQISIYETANRCTEINGAAVRYFADGGSKPPPYMHFGQFANRPGEKDRRGRRSLQKAWIIRFLSIYLPAGDSRR